MWTEERQEEEEVENGLLQEGIRVNKGQRAADGRYHTH